MFGWLDKLITEFDPDAPIRQDRELSEDDRKNQQDLLKGVWDLIRKGNHMRVPTPAGGSGILLGERGI